MESLSVLKEKEVLDTPLLLFECTLGSGTVERWSTHAVTVQGEAYAARVVRHNDFNRSSWTDDGIDVAAKVSVTLANTDSHLSQLERTEGWKGAKLTVWFCFLDLASGTLLSEPRVVFRGVGNPPDEITETTMRLTFSNRLALQRVLLPAVRIQKRCPWTFPCDSEQREEALDGGTRGSSSPFFQCGYSADLPGGLGNLDNGSPFTSCDCTRTHCEQRGMFDEDDAGSPTRRFGGIEFLPASIAVRSHGESGSHVSSAVANEARYNDFVPLVYGTAWFEPPIVFARNDGNLTRMEVLLGLGEVEEVEKVVVNGIEIPEARENANMTATGWFRLVSAGDRTGEFNSNFTDGSGQPLGDPHGSMAVLSVVVPNQVSEGKSLPKIQVLTHGLKLETYGLDGVSEGTSFTNNPAWVLLDLLRRCGWRDDEVDLVSFAETAAHCEELIPAKDLYGSPVQIPRYQCNLVVRKRRSAADLVRGVRSGSGLLLTYGHEGRLQLCAEGALAQQQPEKPELSNATESLSGGWPAYEFGDGSTGFSGILRRDDGAPTLRLWSLPTASCPNRYSVEFQDAFNEYQQDSLSLVDVDDALATGQEVTARLSALGIPNFHQAARMIKRHLDKGIRGNQVVEFETSVRSLGLKPGDIITITYLKEGLIRQPFRVVKLSAGLNHLMSKVTCQIHDDAWYTDLVSLDGGSQVSRRQTGGGVGVPRPLGGATVDTEGRSQFSVEEVASEGGDGSMVVGLTVGFHAPGKPVETSAGIPLLSLASEVEVSGGTLAGGQTLYYALSAVDSTGGESPLSFVVKATVPDSTDTNRVTLQGLSFSAHTSGFHVYRGNSPVQLMRIASDVPVATTFTDDGLAYTTATPVDENYDHAKFFWRYELAPESPATVWSGNSIGCDLLPMITNEYAGQVVRIMSGTGEGQERSVLSNDVESLVVSPPWGVEPDSTSVFVVAESGWRFGAAGAGSPVQFDIQNRPGTTVQVSGRSANALGRECPYELCPLTRWMIGGAAGNLLDQDVPGRPMFGLHLNGQGTVDLMGIGFADLTNTRGITAGTLTVHYWDEMKSPTELVTNVLLGEGDDVVEVNVPANLYAGAILQIESEIAVVDEVVDGGARHEVTRGSFGTTPVSHAAGTAVYVLDRKDFVIPFVRDFFGSPASGSFSHPVFLPDARIGCAEFFVTNERGSSEVERVNFTATVDEGLRTLSGGQLSMQVEGSLAIESNAVPTLVMEDPHSVRDVSAMVREAPVGAPVEMEVVQDGVSYCTLTIPAGQKYSNVVSGFGLPPLAEKAEIGLNILSVGQTADTTTGRDLTVTVRL